MDLDGCQKRLGVVSVGLLHDPSEALVAQNRIREWLKVVGTGATMQPFVSQRSCRSPWFTEQLKKMK